MLISGVQQSDSVYIYIYIHFFFRFLSRIHYYVILRDFPSGQVVKTSPSIVGSAGSILVRKLRYHMPPGQNTEHKTEEILYKILSIVPCATQ